MWELYKPILQKQAIPVLLVKYLMTWTNQIYVLKVRFLKTLESDLFGSYGNLA